MRRSEPCTEESAESSDDPCHPLIESGVTDGARVMGGEPSDFRPGPQLPGLDCAFEIRSYNRAQAFARKVALARAEFNLTPTRMQDSVDVRLGSSTSFPSHRSTAHPPPAPSRRLAIRRA